MRRAKRGQALVEFTLVTTLLFLFLLGIIDFSWMFTVRTQAFQATRGGARYAAVHPTAWSNAANPGTNTIEGQIRAQLSSASLPNDDAHITIKYFAPTSSATGTQCGHYSASAGAFVADNGYTQTTCLVPGTSVQVTTTFPYSFITPLLKGTLPGPTITTSASILEEV